MIDLICGVCLICLLSSASLYVVLNLLDPEGDSQNENRTMYRGSVVSRDYQTDRSSIHTNEK